jgi:predicted nucleic acid-binding protein
VPRELPLNGTTAGHPALLRATLEIRSAWDLTTGTATYPEDGQTVNELLATADRRLYKERGIALG